MEKEILRLPPQNLEAEMSVLGGVLLSNTAILKVIPILSIDDFYRRNHGKIFKAMKELHERDDPTDIITLANELKSRDSLDDCGGLGYLTSLVETTPTAANIEHYANLVKEKSLMRKLISIGQGVVGTAYEDNQKSQEIITNLQADLLNLSNRRDVKAFRPLKEVVQETVNVVESIASGEITGIPSGLHMLDQMTGGFHKRELTILGGRPAMGKSALAGQIAYYAATKGFHVGFLSMEMPAVQIAMRLASASGKIPLSRIRNGRVTSKVEYPQFMKSADHLCTLPIFINDSAFVTPETIRSDVIKLQTEKGLDLLIIDYAQLMTGKEGVNRSTEIADISRKMKMLAMDMGIAIIFISQLNRSVESREDKRPLMYDLKESGGLEQDADLIIFLYRQSAYNKKDDFEDTTAEIIIRKQRQGPTGAFDVEFIPEFTLFTNKAE